MKTPHKSFKHDFIQISNENIKLGSFKTSNRGKAQMHIYKFSNSLKIGVRSRPSCLLHKFCFENDSYNLLFPFSAIRVKSRMRYLSLFIILLFILDVFACPGNDVECDNSLIVSFNFGYPDCDHYRGQS
ncbi:hypothetical protein RCL_jg8463.t1 [Rhizophagus clarus]|uniref:Uncharacterized protein n=1 Tax=Rhizophagus clarus TaxID=94130 RepID=A0A8H3R421_9GLOM|nr:hypothetical protein RCL_jg8463.t1 [Rhizophagus clarus]